MSVSNEDRDSAIRAAYESITWDSMISVGVRDDRGSRVINLRSEQIVRDVITAVIAHGWGPKPTVELRALAELRTRVRGHMMIANYLREQGCNIAE